MKLFTVLVFVAVMMALTWSAAVPEKDAKAEAATQEPEEEEETPHLLFGSPPSEDEEKPGSDGGKDKPAAEENKESRNGTDASKGKHHIVKRAANCPCRWSQFGTRCFRYFSFTKSWTDAQTYCQGWGANLASVHNAYENMWVRSLARNNLVWTGGSDAQQNGNWFWIDGTRQIYQDWCPGQPDNMGNQQHCSVINFSGNKCWDDDDCHRALGFVCAATP